MGTDMRRSLTAGRALFWALFWATSLTASQAQAQLFGPLASETQTVAQATRVLRELNTVQIPQIPHNLLASAEAVAIVPGMMRGAFVVGLQRGRGVVLIKDAAGAWSPPQFVTLTGGSVGWQAGIQATDLVLVFSSRGSVENLLRGKITVGVDASAAAGPVGRRVSAATDLPLKAEIYSYSRSRGLFAGVSLDGSSLQMDTAATNLYYATAPPQTLPPTALELIDQLRPFAVPPPSAGAPGAGGPGVMRPSVRGPGAGAAVDEFGSPAALGAPLIGPTANGSSETSAFPNRPGLPGVAASGASLSRSPLAAAAPAETAETIRRQLADAVARLDPLLDAQWKGYLQVPGGLLQSNGQSPGGQPAPGGQPTVQQVLQRYDAVAANPRYAGLGQRPEFQRVRQLLHRLAALQTQPAPLDLPPPPGG